MAMSARSSAGSIRTPLTGLLGGAGDEELAK